MPTNLCLTAGISGQLDSLLWLLKNGIGWKSEVLTKAAERGHWNLLEWAIAEDYWPTPEALQRIHVFGKAALHGSLEILEWLLEKGCLPDGQALSYAASRGHVHVMEWWIKKFGVPTDYRIWVASKAAAENGHLKTVKWLFKTFAFPENKWLNTWAKNSLIISASKSGNLELVRWVYEKYPELSSAVTTGFASSGSLEGLQWARSLGCKWTESVLEEAGAKGHLEIYEWALLNGCPNQDNLKNCAKNGNFEIIKFRLRNAKKYPLDRFSWPRLPSPILYSRKPGCCETALLVLQSIQPEYGLYINQFGILGNLKILKHISGIGLPKPVEQSSSSIEALFLPGHEFLKGLREEKNANTGFGYEKSRFFKLNPPHSESLQDPKFSEILETNLRGINWDHTTAVRTGHLLGLKKTLKYYFTSLINEAISCGQLKILQWFRKKRRFDFQPTYSMVLLAGQKHQWACAKWLWENGGEANRPSYQGRDWDKMNVGHAPPRMRDWLNERKLAFGKDEEAEAKAREESERAMAEWLAQNAAEEAAKQQRQERKAKKKQERRRKKEERARRKAAEEEVKEEEEVEEGGKSEGDCVEEKQRIEGEESNGEGTR
jgi:hypothetical protein